MIYYTFRILNVCLFKPTIKSLTIIYNYFQNVVHLKMLGLEIINFFFFKNKILLLNYFKNEMIKKNIEIF